VPLLKRGRRGVTPTPAGHTLAEHARTIIAQVERMRGDLSVYGSGLKGRIRLFANTGSLVELIPAAIRRFLAAYPAVDIELDESTSAEAVIAVADGRVDFAVVADSTELGELETIQLAEDRLVLVAPKQSILGTQSSVAFADTLDQPFIGLSSGALEQYLGDRAHRLGRRINYRVRLRSFEAIARLVEAGIGVGVMPMSAIASGISEELSVVDLMDPWADRHLLISARRLAELSRHARALVDEIVFQSGDVGSNAH
jgi:DNA-binding transcriptional LysR family regulator